ncbi:MAG: hypothetical protein WDW36_004042 [Sanguina aurantia]
MARNNAGMGLPQSIDLSPFQFSHRHSLFDWRMLHGIDIDTVVRLTDVASVEAALETLQTGSLDAEKSLSAKNFVQLYRLAQLAIEYLAHLRNVHLTLQEHYGAAIHAADSWSHAARGYLEAGNAFLAASMHAAVLDPSQLAEMDAAKALLEQQDALYNQALDTLEVQDARSRHFYFRKQRSELDWQALCSVDVDALLQRRDTAALERVLPHLTFGSILGGGAGHPHRQPLQAAGPARAGGGGLPDVPAGSDGGRGWEGGRHTPCAQTMRTLPPTQSDTPSSRSRLEQEAAMSQLQRSCADIPALTTATAQLHSRLTQFLLTSHTVPSAQPGLHAPPPPYTTTSSGLGLDLGLPRGPPSPMLGYPSPARLPTGNPPSQAGAGVGGAGCGGQVANAAAAAGRCRGLSRHHAAGWNRKECSVCRVRRGGGASCQAALGFNPLHTSPAQPRPAPFSPIRTNSSQTHNHWQQPSHHTHQLTQEGRGSSPTLIPPQLRHAQLFPPTQPENQLPSSQPSSPQAAWESAMAAAGMGDPKLDPNNFPHQQSGGVGGGGVGVGAGVGEGWAAQGPSPMSALQASAAEMQYQVHMLEQALRGERSGTEEMKRLLQSMRGLVTQSQGPPGGVWPPQKGLHRRLLCNPAGGAIGRTRR